MSVYYYITIYFVSSFIAYFFMLCDGEYHDNAIDAFWWPIIFVKALLKSLFKILTRW